MRRRGSHVDSGSRRSRWHPARERGLDRLVTAAVEFAGVARVAALARAIASRLRRCSAADARASALDCGRAALLAGADRCRDLAVRPARARRARALQPAAAVVVADLRARRWRRWPRSRFRLRLGAAARRGRRCRRWCRSRSSCSGTWRFFPPSEYIIGGKDPGVYLNEGVQIAQRGALSPAGPDRRRGPQLRARSVLPVREPDRLLQRPLHGLLHPGAGAGARHRPVPASLSRRRLRSATGSTD